jgi:Ca2+-binding EF-hand superfamily protein
MSDDLIDAFERQIAQRTALDAAEVKDARIMFNLLSQPTGKMSAAEGHHFLSMLGYRECIFPPQKDQGTHYMDFHTILEVIASKKEPVMSWDEKFKHVFRMLDVYQTGTVDKERLQFFCGKMGKPLSDYDAEMLAELISSSARPNKFKEQDFVNYMVRKHPE